jgi:uroporphyrinogen decarboxylase
MYGDPATWHALCERLAEITLTFLEVQVRAGVSAVQLFDSWVGALSEADYRDFVLPHSRRIFDGIRDVPTIHFGVGTAQLLTAMADAGPTVVGVDWRTPLDVAARLVSRPVQGNLDPCVLFAPWEVIEREVRRVVAEGRRAPGHIFNLGHGVMPETDPEVLTRVVELVHRSSGLE